MELEFQRLEFHWGSFFINNFELSTCILTFSELEYYGTRVSYTRFPLTFFFPQKARLAPLYSKSKWNSSFIYSSSDGFFFFLHNKPQLLDIHNQTLSNFQKSISLYIHNQTYIHFQKGIFYITTTCSHNGEYIKIYMPNFVHFFTSKYQTNAYLSSHQNGCSHNFFVSYLL